MLFFIFQKNVKLPPALTIRLLLYGFLNQRLSKKTLVDDCFTKTDSAVLAAEAYGQELSDFTVMSEETGKAALADRRDDHIIVHEFAHQWWGVRVSCADWTDFWLNEALAEFMMAAYRERRFGRSEYEDGVERARQSYEQIRTAGKDRQLAFRHPITESQAGSAIVYRKGLLVLHLLRSELGERAFWAGGRRYTRRHFNGVTVTSDFQAAMEAASRRSLSEFFAQWIYRTNAPKLIARHRLEKGQAIVEIEQRQAELASVPVSIAVETARGRQNRRIVLTGKRKEVRFFAPDLRSVRVDATGIFAR